MNLYIFNLLASYSTECKQGRNQNLKLERAVLLLVACSGYSFRLSCLTANEFFFFFFVNTDAHLRFLCGSRALFTGPTSTFLAKTTLKLGLMALFTHLKIILLQYFQFSIFSN